MLVLILLGTICCITTNLYAVERHIPNANPEAVKSNEIIIKKEWEKLSKKEKRAKKRAFRKSIKELVKSARQRASDTDLLLLVIIAILLPPLAMALYDGITNRFWISLLLTLLFYLPGLIYTLVVILGEN